MSLHSLVKFNFVKEQKLKLNPSFLWTKTSINWAQEVLSLSPMGFESLTSSLPAFDCNPVAYQIVLFLLIKGISVFLKKRRQRGEMHP